MPVEEWLLAAVPRSGRRTDGKIGRAAPGGRRAAAVVGSAYPGGVPKGGVAALPRQAGLVQRGRAGTPVRPSRPTLSCNGLGARRVIVGRNKRLTPIRSRGRNSIYAPNRSLGSGLIRVGRTSGRSGPAWNRVVVPMGAIEAKRRPGPPGPRIPEAWMPVRPSGRGQCVSRARRMKTPSGGGFAPTLGGSFRGDRPRRDSSTPRARRWRRGRWSWRGCVRPLPCRRPCCGICCSGGPEAGRPEAPGAGGSSAKGSP